MTKCDRSFSSNMVRHIDWPNVRCADCLNPFLVSFRDGMIYCPPCENYVLELV